MNCVLTKKNPETFTICKVRVRFLQSKGNPSRSKKK
jgi:hypothetical protein